MRVGRALVAVAALVSATGCLASKNDISLLQGEIRSARAAAARSDTAQATRDEAIARNLTAAIAALSVAQRAQSDSIRQLSQRLDAMTRSYESFRLSTTDSLRSFSAQLAVMREMMTLVANQMPELKSQVAAATERFNAASAALSTPVPAATTATDTSAARAAIPPDLPPAAELLRSAKASLSGGSCNAARKTLSSSLAAYPNDELVPDALMAMAESHRICPSDRNNATADSVYGEVVNRFPSSLQAPSALFKQATIRGGATNAAARALYERIIREYPRSDAAPLACQELKRTTGCP